MLANSQLVLNILSLSTPIPVNFPPIEVKPMNCLSTLTTIPEAISSEPSCSNLHDLSKENIAEPEQSWQIYESDQGNSKSTDALLVNSSRNQNSEAEESKFPPSISFSLLKESQHKSNSNCSLSRASLEATEKPMIARSRSGSKNASKMYEPISNESLTDSQGYMDDFDESCALIANENKNRISSSNDLITKRNTSGANKAPQSHRFSAGDADKLEKGIKALPSTRSLRDSWISPTNDSQLSFHVTIFETYQRKISIANFPQLSVYATPNVYQF